MSKVDTKIKEYKTIAKHIRDNEVLIAQTNASILELEKYNTKIETELNEINKDTIGQTDIEKLETFKSNLDKAQKIAKEFNPEHIFVAESNIDKSHDLLQTYPNLIL